MLTAIRLNATTYPIEPIEHEELARVGIQLIGIEGQQPKEIVAAARNCDALLAVSSSVPRSVIQELRQCRVISRLGAGTDKIDVACATERGIVVTNVPDFCLNEQAEQSEECRDASVRECVTPSARAAFLLRDAERRLSRVAQLRHGGPDQVRVPGEPSAARWERHQFYRGTCRRLRDQHLFAGFRPGDDLGQLRLRFFHRECHGQTIDAGSINSIASSSPPMPRARSRVRQFVQRPLSHE